MSITNQRHSLPPRSRSQDAGSRGVHPAPRRSLSQPVKPRPSDVPAVMGPPNHAPGVPIMGAPSRALHLEVMGGPDTGLRPDPMGGPDAAPRMGLMGVSDLTFVDSLFTQRKSIH